MCFSCQYIRFPNEPRISSFVRLIYRTNKAEDKRVRSIFYRRSDYVFRHFVSKSVLHSLEFPFAFVAKSVCVSRDTGSVGGSHAAHLDIHILNAFICLEDWTCTYVALDHCSYSNIIPIVAYEANCCHSISHRYQSWIGTKKV